MSGLWKERKGQAVLEYALLITTAIVVIIGVQIYFRRALHGRWKGASDQIGEQFTAARPYTIETREQSSREEASGTAGQITDKHWSQSTVLNTLPKVGTQPAVTITGVGGKLAAYRGHETTIRDYSSSAIGAQEAEKHGTFDSGQYSNIKLFEDD